MAEKRLRRWTLRFGVSDAHRVAKAAQRVGLPVGALARAAVMDYVQRVEAAADADPHRQSARRLRRTLARLGVELPEPADD